MIYVISSDFLIIRLQRAFFHQSYRFVRNLIMRPPLFLLFCLSRCALETTRESVSVNTSVARTNITSGGTKTKTSPDAQTKTSITQGTLWAALPTSVPFINNNATTVTANGRLQMLSETTPVPLISSQNVSSRQRFVTKSQSVVGNSTSATLHTVGNRSDHGEPNAVGTNTYSYYNTIATEETNVDRENEESKKGTETTPITISYQSTTNILTTREKFSVDEYEGFFSLETENITQCLKRDSRLMFQILSGHISFSIVSSPTTEVQKCVIQLIVPVDKGMDLFFSSNSSDCETITTTVYFQNSRIYSTCYPAFPRLRVPGRNITLVINMKPSDAANADQIVNISSIPRPRIEINFTSATAGYVQSPGWDGHTQYPVLLDQRDEVKVPANHSVMISFFQLQIEGRKDYCQFDSLTVTIDDKGMSAGMPKDFVWCNNNPFPKPEIYHTDLLTFRFVTDRTVQYSGFKMLFSFHRYPSVPVKTPSGLWNCSVDYWPQFQQHIGMCNSINECYTGEDEANCSHLYQDCERGSISIGGRCYVLVVHDHLLTWNEAANECFGRNSYLASLNTPDEWDQVIQFITSINSDIIYFGLHTAGPNVPELYRGSFQWSDETPSFFVKIRSFNSNSLIACFYLPNDESSSMGMKDCNENFTATFLCEKNVSPIDVFQQSIHLETEEWSRNNSHVTCPVGHTTWKFLACDDKSECWASQMDSSSFCNAPLAPQPPSFQCNNGVERVSYTLVCDHRQDCSDNSDENFCFFPPCRNAQLFQCTNKQCVFRNQRCDKIEQCLDGSDERKCSIFESEYNNTQTQKPPAIVNFDRYGVITVKSMLQSKTSEPVVCPKSHFLCPGNWTYCMPVFLRCNGVFDCPGQEDERGCDSYVCPGFYRCRTSSICVHASHVCDGMFQCPQRDDELLCDLVCPVNCICLGLAFFCSGPFPFKDFPELRFLDGQGSAIKLENLHTNTMLIFINVAKCGLTQLPNVEFPNLRKLDLSHNRLRMIGAEDIVNMKKLQMLSLAGNPLTSLFVTTQDPSLRFPLLQFLDVSDISLITLNISIFSVFPSLMSLNLSGCGTEHLVGGRFHSLIALKYLDAERCPMHDFPKDIFQGLLTLTEVWTDNYKLCCPANLPDNFNMMNCHSPSDEISSCDALLRSDFYRVILSLFSALALLGNLCSFVYRVCVNRASNFGFDTFVTHLCVSDFLMGVYLTVIGVADRLYMGIYLWSDTTWRQSSACKLAGFLSLISSEVSAFIICLITFDRFLVIRFPFSRLRFRKKSAHVACGIAWVVGAILAGIPLLPMNSHWEFYSQNGICIPLPITRNTFAGHDYSFIVMIIVNFVLFLFIAAGQVFIYWSVRTNRMKPGDSTNKSKDLTIARRLITIAMSDFLCWFPIGLLGVLASSGVPIPGEVNVAVAIIILPVNSAINPFLYTINMLQERRTRAQEQRIRNVLLSEMSNKYAQNTIFRLGDGVDTKREALNLIQTWLANGVVPLDNLEAIIMDENEKRKTSIHPTE